MSAKPAWTRRRSWRKDARCLALGLLCAGWSSCADRARLGHVPSPALAVQPRGQPAAPRWSLRVAALLRRFSGTTKVGELGNAPASLGLGHDLGMNTDSGAHVELAREVRTLRLLLEGDLFSPSGHGRLSHDFIYNDGLFRKNLPFATSSRFLFVRTTATFPGVLGAGADFDVGPSVGFEYPQFRLGIRQPGVDSTTENYHQFFPYPVLGAAGRWRLGPTLELDLRLTGSYIHRWPTPFQEGGRLYMSARTLMAEALAAWRVAGRVHLDVGLQYQYWDGELHSHEDDNRLTFSSPGLFAGLDLRF